MKKLIQKWLGITEIESDIIAIKTAAKFVFDDTRNDIKKLKDRHCLTVKMFDRFKILESIVELEDKVNAMARANMSQALECRIGELEDIIKEESDGISNV